jgi:hypothetical protein
MPEKRLLLPKDTGIDFMRKCPVGSAIFSRELRVWGGMGFGTPILVVGLA